MTGEGRHPGDDPDVDPNVGMLRPEFVVVGDQALVPPGNLIRPAPNQFTHELVADEPYRLDRAEPAGEPDGVLPAGTRVALLVQGDDHCRVVDGTGLYVEVRRASLRRLPTG
jgi:hypothetical protein